MTFTVKECSNARFRFRSFTVFPTTETVPREVTTPVIANAAGTERSADPIFWSHQFVNVAVNCLLVPAVVVDGETVIVNGFGITIVALAAGAIKPIIMVATSVTATIEPNVSLGARRIGGTSSFSSLSTTGASSSIGEGHEPKGLGSFWHG